MENIIIELKYIKDIIPYEEFVMDEMSLLY